MAHTWFLRLGPLNVRLHPPTALIPFIPCGARILICRERQEPRPAHMPPPNPLLIRQIHSEGEITAFCAVRFFFWGGGLEHLSPPHLQLQPRFPSAHIILEELSALALRSATPSSSLDFPSAADKSTYLFSPTDWLTDWLVLTDFITARVGVWRQCVVLPVPFCLFVSLAWSKNLVSKSECFQQKVLERSFLLKIGFLTRPLRLSVSYPTWSLKFPHFGGLPEASDWRVRLQHTSPCTQPWYPKVKVLSTQDKHHISWAACRAALPLSLAYKNPCHHWPTRVCCQTLTYD